MQFFDKLGYYFVCVRMKLDVLIYKIFPVFVNEHWHGVGNRSDSDDGKYLFAVRKALKSGQRFRNFKRHPFYNAILEHVTKEQGEDYLRVIIEDNSDIIKSHLGALSTSDELGNPSKFLYSEFGWLSPTTLRYLKVASDLKKYWGQEIGNHIAEIGCGYGGQLLVLDSVFHLQTYTMFDLPPVCQLIQKYVETNVYAVRIIRQRLIKFLLATLI